MAANNLVVTPEELESTATNIKTQAEKYKSAYTDVFAEFSKIDAAWDGEDNSVFNDKVNSFRHDFEAMSNFFESLENFLNTAAKNYREEQRAVKQNASNLKQ